MSTNKKISPQAIAALENALSLIYWYKNDLKKYLYRAINHSEILAVIDWDDNKRNIVARVINILERNGEKAYPILLQLICDVSDFDDFAHLERLDNGKEKVRLAKDAIVALRRYTSGYSNLQKEKEAAQQRREKSQKQQDDINRVKQNLEELKKEFYKLSSSKDFQARGYALEKFLNQLFGLYDLDPKASFKVEGEQIDGAFTFNNEEYLLEAKWKTELTNLADLDSFSGKLRRRLENTLGLFISINGFSTESINKFACDRKLMLLMDGNDLIAVLDERITLPELLKRKKRAAAQTGNIYFRYQDMIG